MHPTEIKAGTARRKPPSDAVGKKDRPLSAALESGWRPICAVTH
jgi:hypothetical protein